MSRSLPDDVRKALTGTTEGITAIIAIGNSLRRDDGAGTYIAEKTRAAENFRVFNTGERPENFIETIISLKPAAIVLLDAADFGGSAGEIRVIPERVIPDTGMSTHALPLKFVCALLRENTGARITFIGIQPADVGFGEELSPEIKRACDEIISLLGESETRHVRP
jgi:hydrogenase 3 maturation protease